jgi:hypothetical protein
MNWQRWQYGVRFLSDNSEAWQWCGRTSRLRAEAEIAECNFEYPNDSFCLVRRPVDERGHPIGSSELVGP